MKKLLCGLLLVTPLAHATINAYVEPYNSICQAAQPCQVGAQHTIRIVNDTPQPQYYHWYFTINADNGDAVSQGGEVTLQPGQEFRKDKFRNIGYMKFNMRGRKALHCATGADGYEHSKVMKDGYVDVN